MDQYVNEISTIEGKKIDIPEGISGEQFEYFQKLKRKDPMKDVTIYPRSFHLVISICYAFFLSLGSIIWLYLLALMIIRFRQRINIKIVSLFIRGLGAVLCVFGLFFIYLSTRMFISM
jgi:hypothetical protein